MFTTERIDINDLFTKGFTVGYLQEEWANKILKVLKNQSWIEVVPDVLNSDGEIDKYYESIYISVASMMKPDEPNRWFKRYMDEFCLWAEPVLSKFENGNSYHVSAFCGTEGYFMEPHSDVGDRSVLDIIAYFGDDIGDENSGGCLDFFKVDVKDPENPSKMTFLDRVVPKHGMIVIFNNMNPTIYHEVTKLIKPGCRRFQLIAQAGMIDKPDWSVDYKAEKGFYSYHKKAVLGNTDSALEILENGHVGE
ncbi:hypothetical protein EN12_23455 [Vibrio cholerae]|nr:hypothetical protein EN12_23455 [Vibrio cholerae]